jgi:predicted RNase H-like HicB family nuclease
MKDFHNFPHLAKCGSIAMRLKIVFEPSDQRGYTAYVPSLPGCISEGNSLQEARENIREAVALYLEPTEEPAPPVGGVVEELTL